jgi:cell division protein FtsQ
VREQAIPHKVGGRAGLNSKGRAGTLGQRPARRGRSDSDGTLIERLRALAAYLPLFGKVVLAIAAAGLIFAGYRAAASASFFQVRTVEVRGTARASSEQVQKVVRREVGAHGVWRADLTALSARLEHLPWVRTAVVTRLLPDGIRVRITERVPRAVVRTAAGHLTWVDEDAVTLSEIAPSDQMPNFFLRGWSEEEGNDARLENRERVKTFMQLAHEWDANGISNRVSEVNLGDLHDVRVQLTGDDSPIDIRLGGEDLAARLGKALKVLDEQRNTPLGPYITYIIMSQKNPIIGRAVGAPPTNSTAMTKPENSPLKPKAEVAATTKPEKKIPAAVNTAAKQDQVKKERQTGESRKRIVGDQRPPTDR